MRKVFMEMSLQSKTRHRINLTETLVQGFLEKHTPDRDADGTTIYHGPAVCQALPTLHIHDIASHQ